VNAVNLTPQGLVEQVRDLVTLPEAALRISRLVNDPNSTSADIGREISNDVALTARLLRIANSPALGQQGKISDISRAITVLGTRQVRDLTVGLAAIRSFEGISNHLVTMESFWRHSLLCAVAASHVAARRRGSRGDSPFVAGLLHDVGQLVLFSEAPELERKALSKSIDERDDLGLYLCEREALGFDHQAVGLALAQSWGLPRTLQECIEFHHEPHRAQAHSHRAHRQQYRGACGNRQRQFGRRVADLCGRPAPGAIGRGRRAGSTANHQRVRGRGHGPGAGDLRGLPRSNR